MQLLVFFDFTSSSLSLSLSPPLLFLVLSPHSTLSPPPSSLFLPAATCYNPEDKGQSYLSTMSTTRTGMTCQSWNSRHQLIHADLFPELRGADNFCRNPGQLKETIWCFISPTVWDYCFVMSNCSKCAYSR